MPRALHCPHCKAPLKPNPLSQVVDCTYCGQRSENPLFRKPKTPGVPTPAGKHSAAMIIAPLLVVLALAGGMAAYVSSQATRGPTPTKPTPVTRPTVKPDAALPADRQLELKLVHYIRCLDDTYWRVLDTRKKYFSWRKKPLKPPTCRERYAREGLFEIGDWLIKTCERALKGAAALPPKLPELHEAAKTYAASLGKLAPVVNKASVYYKKRTFEVDDCAAGKAAHPKLIAGFDQTIKDRNALRKLLVARTRGTLERCIQRAAKAPGMRGTLLQARAIEAAGVMVSGLRPFATAKKASIVGMKAVVAAFVKATRELEGLDKKAREAAGLDNDITDEINELTRVGVAFIKSRGGRRFDRNRRTQLRWGWDRHGIDGTFEKVMRHYNKLVTETRKLKGCGALLLCEDDACPRPR